MDYLKPRRDGDSRLRKPARHSMAPSRPTASTTAAPRRVVSSATAAAGRSTTPVSTSKTSKPQRKSIADLVAEDRKSRRGSASPHTGSPFRFPLTPSSANRFSSQTPPSPWHAKLVPKWPRVLTMDYAMEVPGKVWDKVEDTAVFAALEDLDAVGWAVGLGCNAVHLFLRLCNAWANSTSSFSSSSGWWTVLLEDDEDGSRLEEVKRLARESDREWSWWSSPTGWFDLTTILSLGMVVLSCANAYRLFTTTRAYRLHHRRPDDGPIKSPNARLISDPTYVPPPPPSLLSRAFSVLSVLFGRSPTLDEGSGGAGEIVQLDVWTPTELNLRLFVLYPPPNALLWHCVGLASQFPLYPIAMVFLVAQTHLLVSVYSQLVRDRYTVQQEVMREYNQKFVYPRTAQVKRDACVMTSSAEFIRRDEWRS